MSSLFTETSGQGPALLVLHGWGMNSHVWQTVKTPLSQRFLCTWLDLPGHGMNRAMPLGHLEETLERLIPCVPDQCILLGWSLGGVLAQALAKKIPERIKGLILVASSPCFVQTAHWSYGLPQRTLNDFAESLQEDYNATLKRFFALQFMGSRHAPKALQQLQKQILTEPPHPHALLQGLQLLQVNQTQQLVEQPTRWILGQRDQLVPSRLADYLREQGQDVCVIPAAGHVPFVTHQDEFLQQLDQFCQQQGWV